MNYADLWFIILYLPAFLLIYRVVPGRVRSYVMILGSLLFYGIGTWNSMPWAVAALFGSALFNYLWYLFLCRKRRVFWLWKILTILINITPLALCKLYDVLPLGVSFYTFQVISLQVDLWKRQERGLDRISLIEYLEFLLMFPKLVMGPLARIEDVRRDREQGGGLSWDSLEQGLLLFSLGLGMKVLLADQLATLWNSICVSGVAGLSAATAWLGAVTYSMELYFDFWGYSLMAIGIGRACGITLPVNFDNPYAARTVGEFWRRWHITLGVWLRDYVYIPLGGSRKGPGRLFISLLLTWLLTGAWHGTGWNFIVWGLVLFGFVLLEKWTVLGRLAKTKVLGHLYVVILLPITWMLFAHTDLKVAVEYIGCMFGIHVPGTIPAKAQTLRYLRAYWPLLSAGVVLSTPFPAMLWNKIRDRKIVAVPMLGILLLSLYLILKSGSNPFLYFQF